MAAINQHRKSLRTPRATFPLLRYLLELQRDCARSETYDLTTDIVGAYSLGIIHAETMPGEHYPAGGDGALAIRPKVQSHCDDCHHQEAISACRPASSGSAGPDD